MAYVFKIDNVAIPTPTEYTFGVEELSSERTGRTLDGKMHKDVVAVKDSYTCKWKRLSWEDAATLLNAVDGKQRVSFTHADPRQPNTMVTYDFYIGERTSVAGVLKDATGGSRWENIGMTFIRI